MTSSMEALIIKLKYLHQWRTEHLIEQSGDFISTEVVRNLSK